jgi:hypothetical protein
MPTNLIGPSVDPPRDTARVPLNVQPDVRTRLRKLLFAPELHAVGFSEFINRACAVAETEIAEARREDAS